MPMAAVAGSKGRIVVDDRSMPKQSFQALLAGRLMDGTMSAGKAVQALLDARRLREVGVDTNMICNLSCKYCYLDDRPEAKGMIHPSEWNVHLQSLVEAGTKLIAFIGKEPLADTIALDVIDLLNEQHGLGRNFRIGMVTNGTFIDRRIDRLVMFRSTRRRI
jgi:sulfatase maturation enzyme AslB (radical SAM superfamily)